MADHPTSPMSQTLANNTGIVACSRIVECDLRTTNRNRSGTPVTWPPYDVISVSTPSASGMALDFVAGDTNRSDVPTLLSPMTKFRARLLRNPAAAEGHLGRDQISEISKFLQLDLSKDRF